MRRSLRGSVVIGLALSNMLGCSSSPEGSGQQQPATMGIGGQQWFPGGSGFAGIPPSSGAGGAAVNAAGNAPVLTGDGGIPNMPPSNTAGAPITPQGTGGTLVPPFGTGGATPSGVGGSVVPPATGGAPNGTAGAGPIVPGDGTTCLKPAGDFSKAGPYQVTREVVDLGTGIDANQATGQFTIFYPQPFEANCPHPIVAWGNGTGVTGADVYAFFNNNAASWGVVVIAAHDSNTGSGNYHRKGLDYLLAQNADPSSKFYGKLGTSAGVTGHSQGGFGAARASTHPNVKALVPVGASGTASASLGFLCLTGTADIAPDACRSSVQAARGPALAAIWEGGDHVTTETVAGYIQKNPGTIQMMRLYAAWFRCFLADDGVACAMFKGAPTSCGICQDQGWNELVAKNL
jgi:hypothetical protein